MQLRKGKLLKIAKNENSDKLIDIVTEILNFSKQQKVKGFRILTPKQMFQRLAIALAQVQYIYIHIYLYIYIYIYVYSLY